MSKVQMLNPIVRNGKGSFPRSNFMCDPEYKKNFDSIFRKKKDKKCR